ncbi:helix-turn-helix domain-containing protein [Frateuria soli]|uniref:helix-turn-helix domain-containing protein n=1 Tax=Frateuria soli TaxID=1542730 RepID=UPI001E65B21A|nr:helix-turn-helix domain-containing protein [Frateuria soli]UGB39117.1 helix-turn-helix domain-containing protein [Frateuria soli]
MNPSTKLAYGIEQAADALGISRSRAYQAIATGELSTYKDGRRRMVSAKALEAYVAKKERESQGRHAA